MLDAREPIDDAVDSLYSTFARYRLGDDFIGCDDYVRPGDSERLAERPLRDLTYEELERYARKAMTTWGTTGHFKYFLPRLLELTIEHRDDFLDLAVVFGKLSYARWGDWPPREQRAVRDFLDRYWEYQLAQPLAGASSDAINTVLCAIANACPSVQPHLDAWVQTKSDRARQHLAAFVLLNSDTLLRKGRLFNAFWQPAPHAHGEVIRWLQADATLDYLENGHGAWVNDALPQLVAIRSRLCATHT